MAPCSECSERQPCGMKGMEIVELWNEGNWRSPVEKVVDCTGEQTLALCLEGGTFHENMCLVGLFFAQSSSSDT